jgi:uncharacterized lipoprotein YmbA
MKKLFALCTFTLVTGCTVVPSAKVDTTRFFVLSSPDITSTSSAATNGVRLSIKKIEIPAYLQTRSIVINQTTNEVRIEDMNRWAEPLDSAIGRVVKAGLLQNAHICSVQFAPLSIDSERDYDISITVHKCEGFIGTGVNAVAQFSATVEIATPSPRSQVIAKYNFVSQEQTWNGSDFTKLAEALSNDILALGSDIANHVP